MCVIPEGFGNDFDPLPFEEFERAKERQSGKKTKKKTLTILPFFLVDHQKMFLSNGNCGEREEGKREIENMEARVRGERTSGSIGNVI